MTSTFQPIRRADGERGRRRFFLSITPTLHYTLQGRGGYIVFSSFWLKCCILSVGQNHCKQTDQAKSYWTRVRKHVARSKRSVALKSDVLRLLSC